MGGKSCIRGLRVTVGTIVGLVAAGYSTAEILQAYPHLEEGDVRQALEYASWRVKEIETPSWIEKVAGVIDREAWKVLRG